jgi:hypothetical protein
LLFFIFNLFLSFFSLQKRFGIETQVDDPMRKLFATTGGMNTVDSGGFGFGIHESSTSVEKPSNGKAVSSFSPGHSRARSRSRGRGKTSSPPRDGRTLHIQTLTEQNLKSSLIETLVRCFSFFCSVLIFPFITRNK